MSTEENSTPSASSAEDAAKTLDQIRLAQAKRLGRLLALFVVLPTLATAVYDLALASKQYQSETTLTLDAGVGSEPATAGSPLARDIMMLETFIVSREMVDALADKHHLREHYAAPGVDALSRLPSDASHEALFEYTRGHMDVDFDPDRAFLNVRVRAFTGAEAERLANAVVAVATENVHRVVEARRTSELRNAQRDADEAVARLGDARAALAAIVVPAVTDAGVIADAGTPEGTSPELERARAAVELAQGRFEATARALDEARTAASRLERRLVVIVAPARPDVASLPRPLRDTLTIFLGTLALLVIGSILISTIKEHV